MTHSNDQSADRPESALDGVIDVNVFDVLCDLIGVDGARLLRQHLRESSRCDEESYPYQRGLATYASLLALTRSEGTMHAITTILSKIQIQQADALQMLALLQQSRIAPKKGWLEISRLGSPIPASKINPDSRLQRGIIWLESLPAYRVRWMLVGVALAVLMFCMSIYVRDRRWMDREVIRLNLWQAEKEVANENLRTEIRAELQKSFEEEINARLQALNPTTFELAQVFERHARIVTMRDGRQAWEFRITKSDGFLESSMDFSEPGSIGGIVYLKYEPDRLPLSHTAPAQSPVATPNVITK